MTLESPAQAAVAQPQIYAAKGYAGDIELALAHQWWQRGEAVIVDVRTPAEHDWVGWVPRSIKVPWKLYPGMAINPDFDRLLTEQVAKDKPILFLCRSGIRSIGSAQRAQTLGYAAYNILEGFEGDPDASKHRGSKNGWQRAGYEWEQG